MLLEHFLNKYGRAGFLETDSYMPIWQVLICICTGRSVTWDMANLLHLEFLNFLRHEIFIGKAGVVKCFVDYFRHLRKLLGIPFVFESKKKSIFEGYLMDIIVVFCIWVKK